MSITALINSVPFGQLTEKQAFKNGRLGTENHLAANKSSIHTQLASTPRPVSSGRGLGQGGAWAGIGANCAISKDDPLGRIKGHDLKRENTETPLCVFAFNSSV